jgi:cold shock CspA family protein
MLTGKVIRFDEVRGYGFIAPDGGGEDVFVHANVLGDDKYVFGPGLRVEFEVTDGDRGPKAYSVHLLNDRGLAPAPALAPAPPPVRPPDVPVQVTPPVSVAPPVTRSADQPALAAPPVPAPGADEELCDVLTAPAFSQEITELLLKSAPALTAAHILDVRAELMQFGRRHGWIED